MASLDLIAGIALTASAAVVVGTMAAIYPGSPGTRMSIVLGFAAWFVSLVTLCALDVFHPVSGIGTPGLGLALLLPLIVIASLALGSPERRRAVFAMPLPALIAVHWVRLLGVCFLLLEAAGRLPAPFALSAGWGDIVIGVTALPVAWAVRNEIAGWRMLAVVFSLAGALDLLVAIGLGVTSAPDSPLRLFYGVRDTAPMATLPWMIIPAFLVPILLLLHVAVLARLFGTRRSSFRLPSSETPSRAARA